MAGAIEVLSGAFMAIATGSGPIGLTVFALMAVVRAAFLIQDAWNPISQWWEELWSDMGDTVSNWYNGLPWPIRKIIGSTIGAGLGFSSDGSKAATGADLRGQRDSVEKGLGASSGRKAYEPYVPGQEETAPAWLTKQPKILEVPASLAARADGVPQWGSGEAVTNTFSFGDIHINAEGKLDDPATARKFNDNLRAVIRKEQASRSRTRDAQGGHR
jgi:hypothetical protein